MEKQGTEYNKLLLLRPNAYLGILLYLRHSIIYTCIFFKRVSRCPFETGGDVG